MKTESIPFAHHGITGGISVKLKNNTTLEDFCVKHVPTYDPDRFEAIALRLFSGSETIVTIYALDKSRQEGSNYNPDKIPVKKFKIHTDPASVFDFFEEYNFTLQVGNYEITDMEIINK